MVFRYLSKFILSKRLVLLALIGIITIVMGLLITNLRMRYQRIPFLPQNDSLLIQYQEFAHIFGKGENVVVLGVRDTNFFKLSHFQEWVKLTDGVRALHGVDQVVSIANAFTIAKDSASRVFVFENIFEPNPPTQQALDSMRLEALSLPFYRNLLYSKEADVYLMMVYLNPEVLNSSLRTPLVEGILSLCHQFTQATGKELVYSGLPYIRITIAELVKGELFLFLIMAALITALILYFLFRSLRIVSFAMLVVGISVVWGLGVMAALGYEVTVLSAIIPPLIIVIGVTNCIYLLNKYHHEYSIHGDKTKALQRMVEKIGSATFLTNLTTAAGVGTFMVTGIQILIEFAIVAATGIMGVYVISLLLIPSIFSYLPPPKNRHLYHLESVRMKNAITRIILIGLYRRKLVFAITIVLIVTGIVGLVRIESNSFIVDDIPGNHQIHKDMVFLEEHFAGILPLEIVVDTEQPRGVLQEAWLNRIDRLQTELEEYPELSRPLSVVEVAKFARQAYYNGNPSQYRLPRGFERNFVLSYLPRDMANNQIMSSLVDSTASVTRILYSVADIGTKRMNDLKRSISSEIDSTFGDFSGNVAITGGSIIVARGYDYLVNGLFTSLLLAIAIISIFIAWMFRQPRMILLSVLTNIVPLIITAAAMGYIGIPLKPSTVIVFSIAFGISVDNSIHFLARFRQELMRTRGNTKASVICAIRETGISMIYTSIVLFFGFGVFTASQFGGTVALGLLVSLTLLVALFSNLAILPAILLSLGRDALTPKKYEEL